MKTLDTLVIGGGVSGLSTAWWLAGAGAAVEVWESSPRPGGKIRTDKSDGFRYEHAATMLVRSDGSVRDLLQCSGLDRECNAIAASKARYLVNGGRLVGLPKKPATLLASSLWTRRGRLRMMLEPLVPRSRLKDETVQEFITRRFGRELYETAMEPYVSGPLASDPERACARSVLPRLTEMERRCGSITAGMLWARLRRRRDACRADSATFPAGMQTLTDRLAAEPSVRFKGGRRVTEIRKNNGRWNIRAETATGEETGVFARHVVLSTAARPAAGLVAGFDQELCGLLGEIEYAPLSVIHLGFDRDRISHCLDGAGFLVPGRENLPVNGVLWMSSLDQSCAPQGKVLLTAYVGGARRPGAVQWSDERSVGAVLATLSGLVGASGSPDFVKIIRHELALPQYIDSYHARTAAIMGRLERHASLHLCANYLGGVAIRNRLECARQCADAILENLATDTVQQGVPAVMNEVCLSGA